MKNESGFTLISVIAVLALSAIIAFGAGATTVQLISINRSNQEHAILAVQPQNLGYWLNQDLTMAMVANTTDDAGTPEVEFTIVEWKDWETGGIFKVLYSWVDSADPTEGVLRTKETYDIDGDLINSVSTRIANNISSAAVTMPLANYNSIILGASAGDRTTSRQYEIDSRPE